VVCNRSNLSLIAALCSLFWANKFPDPIAREFGSKRLNFHCEDERQSPSPAQIQQISLYFPAKQGKGGQRRVRR